MTETAQNKNIEIFEHMPVAKAVRTMAVPTIMGQLIILLYSIADTFFVGRTNNPLMRLLGVKADILTVSLSVVVYQRYMTKNHMYA